MHTLGGKSDKPVHVPAITSAGGNGDNSGNGIQREWAATTIKLAVPALLSTLSDPFLSMVDTSFCGRMGTPALAALAAATSIFSLAFHTFKATTATMSSLISAEPPDNHANLTVSSIRVGVFAGIFLTALLLHFRTPLLSLLSVTATSSPEVYKLAISYLSIRALAAPAVLILTITEGIHRGLLDTGAPLRASLAAASINLVLDPVLIFTLNLGVAGAAAATVAAQYSAAFYLLLSLKRRGLLAKPSAIGVSSSSATTSSLSFLKSNITMLVSRLSMLAAWSFSTRRAMQVRRASERRVSVSR